MKSLIVLAITFIPTQLFASDILGVWKSNASETGRYAHVEFKPCGDKFCGTIVRVYDKNNTSITYPTVGKMVAVDFEDAGDGMYINGTFNSPRTGDALDSQFVLREGRLYLRGCVEGSCRTGEDGWQRVTDF